MSIEHSRQPWGGSHSRAIRDYWQRRLPMVCPCGEIINPTDDWNVGHVLSRGARPDLVYSVANTRPEHRRCSDSGSQQGVIDKAKAEERRRLGIPYWRDLPPIPDPTPPPGGVSAQSRARPQDDRSDPGSWVSRTSSPWLAEVSTVPEDGSVPRVMSPTHPRAVGSYGDEAEKWAADELNVTLRWWQRLALRRLLEHDDVGELVWRQVIITTPRRAGKSVLMIVVACWRLTHGELLGEARQTVLHTGQDLQVVGEVMRLSWGWAERNGHTIRRKNGQESIEVGESRWLMRSQVATFGYEVGLGIVDEAWSVPAQVVDDGVEPGLLHRRSPQLMITSTAHRRATSLMRRRLDAALAGLGEDWSTLLLWWGAAEDAPLEEPATWRSASPYWTDQQQQLIGDRLERALRGEADPVADDPDALAGFACQYLNRWPPPHAMAAAKEVHAFPDALWSPALSEPTGRPTGAAIESTFSGGLAIGLAYPDERGHVVSTSWATSMTDAVDQVLASGAMSLLVGKSLSGDPALEDLGPVKLGGAGCTSRQAVVELRRLLRDGHLRHDGSPLLDGQVRELMVVETTEGPRVRNGCRVDAIKAAVWAVEAARGVVDDKAQIW